MLIVNFSLNSYRLNVNSSNVNYRHIVNLSTAMKKYACYQYLFFAL